MHWSQIISVIVIATSIMYIGTGALIFQAIKGSKIRSSFLLFSSFLSLWSLFYGLMVASPDAIAARFFWAISFFSSLVFLPFWVYFLALLSSYSKRKIKKLIYILQFTTIILSILCIATMKVHFSIHPFYGYQFNYIPNFIFFITFINLCITLLLMLTILRNWIKTSKLIRHKKMALSLSLQIGILAPPMLILNLIRPIYSGVSLAAIGLIVIFIIHINFYRKMIHNNILDITLQNVSNGMFTLLNVPILILNEVNQIVFANNYCLANFQNAKIGHNIAEFLLIDNEKPSQSIFENTINKENVLISTNHGEKNMSMQLTVVRDKFEEVITKIIILSDVTELITERVLIEESIKHFVENSPLPITIWDRKYNMIDWNKEAMELINHKDRSNFPETFSSYTPQFQQNGKPTIEVITTELDKAFTEGSNTISWCHNAPSGEQIQMEVNMLRLKLNEDEYQVMCFSRVL